MKKKSVLRLLSVFLIFTMVVSLIAPWVSATEADTAPTTQQTELQKEAPSTETPSTETPSTETPSTETTVPADTTPSVKPEETTEPATTTPAETTTEQETTVPQETAPATATTVPKTTVPENSITPSATTPETTVPGSSTTPSESSIPTEPTVPETTTPSTPIRRTLALANAKATVTQHQVYWIANIWRPNMNPSFSCVFMGKTKTIERLSFRRAVVDGTSKVAYCMDPITDYYDGQFGGNNVTSEDSWQFSLAYTITKEQQTAIGLTLLYGYPNQLKNPDGDLDRRASYEAATQIIIWEIAMGLRKSTPPYACTNYGLRDCFTGKCPYFDYYASHVREGYDIIETKLANHTVIPSFTNVFAFSAPTHTLEANGDGTFSITLTDENNILSEYTFTDTDTLTFTKSGNKLTITSTEEIGNPVPITPVKYIPALEEASFLILDAGSSNQVCNVLLNEVGNDPVPSYFKLRTSGGTVAVEKSTSTGEDLEGWEFTLMDGTTAVATGTTDKNGKLTIESIPSGTYTLVETVPSDSRYECTNNNQTVTVTFGETTTVQVYNQIKAGKVSIQKATNTGRNLDGWKFGIYSDSACTDLLDTLETDAQGKATSGDLSPGIVYIKEITTKDGWEIDSSVKSVTIVSNQTVTLDYVFTNKQRGNLQITKKTNTSSDLSGWIFTIYSDADCTKVETTLTTGADGKTDIISLIPGTYYYKETGDTSGRFNSTYWPDETEVKSFTVTAGQSTSLTWTNNHYGKVNFVKTTNTGKNLDGWTFTLYSDSACTKTVGTYKTNSNGEVTTGLLAPGTYYAKETAKEDSYWFSDTNVKTVVVTAGKTTDVTIENIHKGQAKIIKKTNTGENLNGWEFSIYSDQSCTKLVTKVTSDAKGQANIYLEPGTYWVKETGTSSYSNEYWTFDTEVKQVVITEGKDTEVSFTNIHNGKIKFVKATNTGKDLADWEITLYADAAFTKKVDTFKTNDKGEVTTGVLVPGTYYAKEVASTDPYWLSDNSVKIITVTAGSTAEVTITNTHNGQAKVTKKTNTGENLDGWEFGIFSEQSCITLVKTITSDEKGDSAVYLAPGTYWVKETGMGSYSDEYWTYDTEIREIVLEAGKDTEVTFTNTHQGKIQIKKTMDTDGPLEGWKFQITKLAEKEEDYEDIGTFTSLEDGTFLTDMLLPGEYKIEELFEENSLYYCKTENPVTVTVKEGETTDALFTNALRPGRIEIEKVNTAGSHLQDAKFLLEWSEDGKTWTPVSYSDKEDVVKGGCTTEGIADGALITPESGIIAFENLYPGIQYRVTELEAPAGYVILKDHAFTGKFPVETLEVKLKVVNSHGYELPSTGGTGTGIPVGIGVMLIVTATVLLMSLCITNKSNYVHATSKTKKKGTKDHE